MRGWIGPFWLYYQTNLLQLGVGFHFKVIVFIHDVVVLKERPPTSNLYGGLQKGCGIVSYKARASELLPRLLVVTVVGGQDVVAGVVVHVAVGEVDHHITYVHHITPISSSVVVDVVLQHNSEVKVKTNALLWNDSVCTSDKDVWWNHWLDSTHC